MDRPDGINTLARPCFFLCATLLLAVGVLPGPAVPLEASSIPDTAAAALSGIPIYPGSQLIALEGPSREVVNLQRPGWEFTAAEVLVVDYLVSDPLSDLRRFFRNRCNRDPLLLLILANDAEDEIVSVRYARQHPLHPRMRWLRFVIYRRLPEPGAHRDGE